MTREEAIQALKDLADMNVRYGCDDKWIMALHTAIEALSQPNMIPIKLEKRYPESRDEDITDAFMRGYLKGKADRPKGEWVRSYLKNDMWHCTVCDAPIMTDDISEMKFCSNCGADMRGAESEVE